MELRRLGSNGPEVSAIGLGCMSLGGAFGATDEPTSHRCLDAACDAGINFLDTANVYGMGLSETVMGSWLGSRKAKMVIATKGGVVREPNRRSNNDPGHLRDELHKSLKRLGVDFIDLYYLHRREHAVPLADVIGALAELVAEGKIGGYGLSEVAPYTVREAHEIHPCLAVQSEYSLWTRQPELGLIQACRELGIAFVPFSPLARGVFSQGYPEVSHMEEGDFRLLIPRFSEPYYTINKGMIDRFKAYAKENGVAVSALALAWVLHQGEHLIPIPGTRTAEHLLEWAEADRMKLDDAQLAEIENILPVGFAYGDRYSDAQMRAVERYC